MDTHSTKQIWDETIARTVICLKASQTSEDHIINGLETGKQCEEDLKSKMKKFIFDSWNAVMDHNKNPLSAIPGLQVRHMVMQILAFMWSTIFAIMILDSIYAFMYSAIGHVIFVTGIVVTVATFKQAERNPQSFNWMNGYHSHGRGRNFVIWRDKNGNPHKQPLPDNDPGGEHE